MPDAPGRPVIETGDFGKSAYELAVKHGFVGTEQEYLDSLKGETGLAVGFTNRGDWLTGTTYNTNDYVFDGGTVYLSKNKLSFLSTVAPGSDSTNWAPLTLAGAPFVPTSRQIITQFSLTGGGNLSADRTLNLVGDVSVPGTNKFYGTDGSGTRGWFAIGAGSGDTISDETVSVDSQLTVYAGTTGKHIKKVTGSGRPLLTSGVVSLAAIDLSGADATGTLAAGRFPALTGDVTTSAGSLSTTLANIPTATPAAGYVQFTDIAAPAAGGASTIRIWGDSTDLRFHDKNAAGTIGTTVVADTGSSNNFLTAISAAGVISKAQPSFSNLSGNWTLAQGPSETASTLLGRTSASAGIPQEITLGTNLSMSGTTLNATGGGGSPGGSNTQIQYNNSGAFGGAADITRDSNGNLVLTGSPVAPYYSQLKVIGATGDSAIFLRTGHSVPTDYFFGAGSGQPNDFFRIVDLTTGGSVTDVLTIRNTTAHEIAIYGKLAWTSTGSADGTIDTYITRQAAGVVKAGDIFDVVTGYRVAGAATSGNVLRGNGTNFVNAKLDFSDLSGNWTLAEGPSETASTLLGRTSAGAGIPQEITLGTNLSMSGTTLNATAGGGGVSSVTGTSPITASPTTGAVVVGFDPTVSEAWTSNHSWVIARSVASGAAATLDDLTASGTTTITGGTTIATAKGFNKTSLYQPVYTGISSPTVTNAATLYIEDAPQASGTVTITNPYALWVDAGGVRLDGGLGVGVTAITPGSINVFGGYLIQGSAFNYTNLAGSPLPPLTQNDYNTSFTVPTTGGLLQPTRLQAASTERVTLAGTGRVTDFDPLNSFAGKRVSSLGSVIIRSGESLRQYQRSLLSGNSRTTLVGSSRVQLFGDPGTVTASGGSLTSNAVVLGAGGADEKVVSGITTNGISQLNLGVDSVSTGFIVLTSAVATGTVTIQPAGATLGASFVTLPVGSSNPVLPDTGAANNFLTGISSAGVITKAQPSFTNISGTATDAQVPDTLTVTAISNLTTNGFVKTSGGVGTLSVDTSTYLTANQTITLTGDVTGSGTTAITTTLANIPTATPAAGYIGFAGIAAPASPGSGVRVWSDSTDFRLHDKNSSGVIGTTVVFDTGASNNFLTAISAAGVISKAQPSFANLSGNPTGAQLNITGTSPIVWTSGTSTISLNVGTNFNFTASQSILVDDANNSIVVNPLALYHTTSGTPANGLGTGISFQSETSTTNPSPLGTLAMAWGDVTDATATSYFDILLRTGGGAASSKARFFGSGGLSVNSTTDPGAGIINANTGFKIANAATTGNVLRGDGTKFVSAQLNFTDLAGFATTAQGGVKTGGTTGQVLAKASNADYDLVWNTVTGTGTVTNTGGALTANSVVLGASGNDIKVVAGIITDGTSKLTLGVSTTSVGSIDFKNLTSGTVTIIPATGALGTVSMTLPAANSNPVIPDTGAANNFLTAISSGGVISKAQPSFSNISGTASLTTQVTGVLPLANGGTAANLTDPNAHRMWGWDDTDNAITFITYGTNLTYDHATHTLNASGGGGSPGGSNTQIQYNNASAFGGVNVMTFNGTDVFVIDTNFKINDGNSARNLTFDCSALSTNRSVFAPDATSTFVVPDAGAANNFLTAISSTGAISKAQPSFANISGTASQAQIPTIVPITQTDYAVTVAVPSTGDLSQPERLGLSSTNRATLAGTGRIWIFDTINNFARKGVLSLGSFMLRSGEGILQYLRMAFSGNARGSVTGNARIVISDFTVGSRLVLAGTGMTR